MFWDILNGHGNVANNIVVPKKSVALFNELFHVNPLDLILTFKDTFWPIEHIISSYYHTSFLANSRKALVMPNYW